MHVHLQSFALLGSPRASYCYAVSLLCDEWQAITQGHIFWLIIGTISYRSTLRHKQEHMLLLIHRASLKAAHGRKQSDAFVDTFHCDHSFTFCAWLSQRHCFPPKTKKVLHTYAFHFYSWCPSHNWYIS